MKNLSVYLLLIGVFATGCKKNHEPTRPDSEFSFTADGKNYVFNGSFYDYQGSVIEIPWWTYNAYMLIAYNTFENYLSIHFPPGQLAVTTYQVTFGLKINQAYYDFSKNCSLTITALSNGLASGTFYGEVSALPGSTPITVSNGRFKNVLVR
jgi:hypothetical protein